MSHGQDQVEIVEKGRNEEYRDGTLSSATGQNTSRKKKTDFMDRLGRLVYRHLAGCSRRLGRERIRFGPCCDPLPGG